MSDPGDTARGPWAALREELVQAGFRPSRRLGQNFLLDENLLRAIVRDAGVEPGARVLEVGPGLGFLTRHLLTAGARVTAVEIDPRLAERTETVFANTPGFDLVRGDVLASKHTFAPAVLARIAPPEPWHLVANLPYAVSGPVLAIAASLPHPPSTMTVLVQLELAQRIVASAGGDDWGPLSIRLQVAYAARIVRRVPPELFWPRPQVDSALVRLDVRADPLPPVERVRLSALVERLFQRRRQRLARVLGEIAGRGTAGREWAVQAGLTGDERAEDLPLETLRRLAGLGPGLPAP
ncbi:MAG: 16S rRNA (adenine(1518)-N(6)/adenine(1519)-N(6))-dimethyltransferase RsmA [Planctomycetota bacterium]|nr:16S rRNA (adenine(1518)-N(6)/adenine(1519)-N(6))-dimethyltransferase RsmA [Planctomycetota bacterium]